MLRFLVPTDNHQKPMMIDYWLLGALTVLAGLGLTMVFSSSVSMAQAHYMDSMAYFKRQSIAYFLGLMIAYFVYYIPIHNWKKNRGYLLLFGYALLIAVLIIGTEVNGSKRWLPLPFFNFQPSELMKLIAIIFMAGFLIKHHSEVSARFTAVMRLAIPFALMGVLLLLEPDFGATFVIMVVLASMLFIAGAPLKHFFIILFPSALLAGLLIKQESYRLVRVQSFMDPWDDPFGTDYQLIQSLLAHGQGGWSGAGLGESVQKLSYLPEAHTDYIFSIFGEEFGFIGVMLLAFLYLFIIYRIFLVGARAMAKGHAFGGLIAYGVAVWIAVQSVINMSVTLGLAPSKGLTLPLFSYGGSSILIFLSALAIVFRIDYEARHLPATFKKDEKLEDDKEPARDSSSEAQQKVSSETSAGKAIKEKLKPELESKVRRSLLRRSKKKLAENEKDSEADKQPKKAAKSSMKDRSHKSGSTRVHDSDDRYQQKMHENERKTTSQRGRRSKRDFR